MSSDGKIVVAYESQVGSLLRSQDQLNKELDKTNKRVSDLDQGIKRVGATQGQMLQAATRVYQEVGGEVERLKQKQLELNVLHKQGFIDEQTHSKQTAAIKKQLLQYDEQYQKQQQQTVRVLDLKRATEEDMFSKARRWHAVLETDQEKQKRQLHELNVLRRNNLLTDEQHAAAIKTLGDSGESTFERMIRGAGRTALGIAGITTAAAAALKILQLVGAEIEANAQRQSQAADHQLGLARPMAAMLRNLGTGDSVVTPAVAQELVKKIPLANGGSQEAFASGMAKLLSARGNLTPMQAFQAGGATQALDRNFSGDEISTLGGAAMDLMRSFPGGTEKQALGLLLAGQQTARVEDTKQYAQNIVPGVVGLQAYGLTAQEAIALTSAMTMFSADKLGSQTKTATLGFASQIVERTNKAGLVNASWPDRLRFLLEDPKGAQIRKQLLGPIAAKNRADLRGLKPGEELTGEAAARPGMIGLLTPGSSQQGLYQQILQTVPEMSAGDSIYDKTIRAQSGIGVLQVSMLDERMRAVLENVRSKPGAGAAGVAIKRLDELSKAMGLDLNVTSGIKDKINKYSLGNPNISISEVLGYTGGVIADEANALIPPAGSPSRQIREFMFGKENAYSQEDRKTHELLRQLLQSFNDLGQIITENSNTAPPPSPNGPRPSLSQEEP